MQYALMGNATSEYLFLCDFFLVGDQAADDLFHTVMGKSLKILMKTVENYLTYSYDCIGLFICLHIVYRYQDILHKQNIRVLDGYWEVLTGHLWLRFETIFILNLESVKQLNALKAPVTDCRPHYIIRRYAEFSSALTCVNLTWPDDRLQQMLNHLQVEADNLLNRLADQANFKDLPVGVKKNVDNKTKLIFLINNYDLILTTFSQNSTETTSESLAFQELLQTKTNEYVEELLFTFFGPLISFTTECEKLIQQDHQESLKRHLEKIPILTKTFANTWKRSIEQINQEAVTSFSSLKQGSNALQIALTQLIQYYSRFQKVLACPIFAKCPARNDLVSIHHIIVEVKKFKPIY
uniref:Vacuolar protein sorting-associated protein 52 homolog n=1 Tax=Romanomermis culicivorax TaxID=13658 RepID=A0A915I029_ROMCU